MISFILISLFVISDKSISSADVERKEDLINLKADEQRTDSVVNRKWPYSFVMYVLDNSYNSTHREMIRSAMDDIKDRTCILWFDAGDNLDSIDYVSIENSSVCEAEKGRKGGKQILSLGTSHCMKKGIILHLLLHTLGIRNEHQRPDRDEYITINWNNIKEGREHNFMKNKPAEADSLGLDYNYRSVMHYAMNTNAKNSSIPVISPKHCDVNSTDLGDGLEHGYLSKLDIQNINKLYECPAFYKIF